MSIIEALQRHHPDDAFDIALVDIFKDYAPRPFNRFDRFYSQITKTPTAWKLSYQWTDSRQPGRDSAPGLLALRPPGAGPAD